MDLNTRIEQGHELLWWSTT